MKTTTYRALLGLAAVLLGAVGARQAQAQTINPRVRISPTGGDFARGSQVSVAIQYCSQKPFDMTTEALTLNNQPVTLSNSTILYGTQSDCNATYNQFERRGNLTLVLGTNSFRARIENDPDGVPGNGDGTFSQALVAYTTPYPVYGVSVIPDDRYSDARPNLSRNERYTITNTGDTATTFTASCTWSGGACSVSPTSVSNLAAGSSYVFTASVSVGAVGSSGTLTFSVSGGAGPFPASASAVTTISAVAGPTTTRSVSLLNPTGISERDLCVTIKAGNDAASECGDLRLAHALPSIRTKGKLRTPVLLYNSALADPVVTIPAQLALGSGFATGDTIAATVVITSPSSLSGTQYQGGRWLGSDWPVNGEAQRITASFDGSSLPTGKYGYRLELRRSSGGAVDSVSGTLLHVNRSTSRLHGGWSVAGVEQLFFPEGGGLLWVGGDGSTRFYAPNGSCVWQAENIDRPDKIVCGANGWYTRLLRDSLKIAFDANGLHRYTVNRLRDTTEFTYTAQQALASIIVPPRRNGVGVASYTFHYNATSGLLDSVSAPPLGATPRRVRLAWVLGRTTVGGVSGGRVLRFDDPDSTSVLLHYANETSGQGDYRVASRVDRRGTTTTFTYGHAWKLASASTPASASQTVVETFRSAEGQGVGASPAVAARSIALDSVYSYLDGPRSDVTDVTKWWVNRLGAPLRVRSPVGLETKLFYNATWPGLADSTFGPSGLKALAVYDAMRALLLRDTVFNPLGDGRNAVTRYVWNATWDRPDSTIAPTGEVVTQGFDANGNVVWQQPGDSAARRVTFDYDATTKQLTAVHYPTIASPEQIQYDTLLLNVSRTTTPGGVWARHVTDGLGRDTLIETPIDSTHNQTQRIIYDRADRVIETRTGGPAMPYSLAGTANIYKDTAVVRADTLVVRTTFDAEGNVTKLQKLSYPYPTFWVSQCGERPQCGGLGPSDSGSVDKRTYDWLHRLLTARLGSKAGTFTYDAAGNVATWQPYLVTSSPVAYAYDAGSRLTRTIAPSRSDLVEYCENYMYGPAAGTPAACFFKFPIYPSTGTSSLVIPADTARLVYDRAGNLSGAYNAYARVDRTYYASGALKTDTLRLRDYAGASFNLKYGLTHVLDLAGRQILLRTPWSADSIRYQYDSRLGTLSDVWQGGAHVRFTYDLTGRQDSLLIGSTAAFGVRERRVYDPDGQLIKRVRTSDSLGTLISDSLVYDLRGKALDVFTVSKASDVGTLEFHDRYSGLGSLVAQQKLKLDASWDMEEFRTTGMGDVYRSRAWHSNATNNDGFPLSAHYNVLGMMVAKEPLRDTSVAGYGTFLDTTYTQMDDGGNVIRTGTRFRSLYTDGPSNQTGSRSYFASDNRLRFTQRYALVAGVRSGSWEEYWYDALGRRVLTRARRDSLCSSTPSMSCASYVERTIWDGDQILYELRGQGRDAATASDLNTDVASGNDYGKVGYVHAGGIDAPLVLMDGRVPNYNWRGLAESSVTLSGAAADCTLMTGTCTTIAWPGNQGVYQMPIPEGTAVTAQPKWVGSLLANGVGSTGMAYRRNRFYDGATGQFNQQDPIGLGGGANSYGFASGDPVSYADPFGLCPPKTMAEVFECTGRMLVPFQRVFEPVATVVANLPLLGMGALAGAGMSGEVLALGNTLRAGAGSGILTAAGVAGRVAEAVGGSVEPLAKSEGFKVTVMEGKTAIVARIKSTGDMRVSVAGKGGMTASGELSSDRALTHFEKLSSEQVTALMNRAREMVAAMRR